MRRPRSPKRLEKKRKTKIRGEDDEQSLSVRLRRHFTFCWHSQVSPNLVRSSVVVLEFSSCRLMICSCTSTIDCREYCMRNPSPQAGRIQPNQRPRIDPFRKITLSPRGSKVWKIMKKENYLRKIRIERRFRVAGLAPEFHPDGIEGANYMQLHDL